MIHSRFPKMVIHTLNHYLGPAGTLLFQKSCKNLKVEEDEFSHIYIPEFIREVRPFIDASLDEFKANQLVKVLEKFQSSRIGSN